MTNLPGKCTRDKPLPNHISGWQLKPVWSDNPFVNPFAEFKRFEWECWHCGSIIQLTEGETRAAAHAILRVTDANKSHRNSVVASKIEQALRKKYGTDPGRAKQDDEQP